MSRATANWLWIRFPTYAVRPPPSRSGARKAPSDGMKTSRQPAAMPGSVCGTTTLQNARAGEAPQSAAASTSALSSFSSET